MTLANENIFYTLIKNIQKFKNISVSLGRSARQIEHYKKLEMNKIEMVTNVK